MQCPVDGAVLEMSERKGVEIDYCPTCRGVWLDRGELDKILERSESWDRDRFSYDREAVPVPYKKKRKSFFSELFDD
jgi:Zn-finger nucleic acid-binding protein